MAEEGDGHCMISEIMEINAAEAISLLLTFGEEMVGCISSILYKNIRA